jgi:hypothetical protein
MELTGLLIKAVNIRWKLAGAERPAQVVAAAGGEGVEAGTELASHLVKWNG